MIRLDPQVFLVMTYVHALQTKVYNTKKKDIHKVQKNKHKNMKKHEKGKTKIIYKLCGRIFTGIFIKFIFSV